MGPSGPTASVHVPRVSSMTASASGSARRTRRQTQAEPARPPRSLAYRRITNPFPPIRVFSDDQVAHMHEAALGVLETLGLRVLSAEARAVYRKAGATVDEGTLNVRIDRGLVEQALRTAPASIDFVIRGSDEPLVMGGNHVAVATTGGAPHISSLDGGKRNGTLADFKDLTKLAQSFDVLHVMGPGIVEAQDVELQFRHLEISHAQLTLTDRVPFIYSRGPGQVTDCLDMVAMAHGLTREALPGHCCCYTAMNTNSPLQLDIPMAHGIMSFAEAGQMVLMTPFTLAGAMAPITIPGALTQAHAEALACFVLSQAVRPGAPGVYGCFTSNVDMRSGAPAFGTPEFVKATFGAGQLARHVGLPFRATNANASNTPDAQAVYESQMSLWGALLGGCNLLYHGAGWLEGGLTISLEKFILDVEMLQVFAELFQPVPFSEDEMALDDIAQVGPGGHYFAAPHTMQRYQDAFYAPLVSDWRNYGQWSEDGGRTATERANAIWKRTIAEYVPPPIDAARTTALADFVARRRSEGGALPI